MAEGPFVFRGLGRGGIIAVRRNRLCVSEPDRLKCKSLKNSLGPKIHHLDPPTSLKWTRVPLHSVRHWPHASVGPGTAHTPERFSEDQAPRIGDGGHLGQCTDTQVHARSAASEPDQEAPPGRFFITQKLLASEK